MKTENRKTRMRPAQLDSKMSNGVLLAIRPVPQSGDPGYYAGRMGGRLKVKTLPLNGTPESLNWQGKR